jgi:hypothetical protein
MSQAFRKVPILNWKLIEHGQRLDFILQLREALINAGFLYILHPPIEAVESGMTCAIPTDALIGSNPTREGVCPEIVRAFH